MLIFFSLFLLHLFLTFGSTYFLSPEFLVYPYFTSKGLMPYLNVIDQHFPLIFFGPLNLAQLKIDTLIELKAVWILIILLTDLGAYLYLKKKNLNSKLVFILLCSFIILQVFLSARTLWLETWALLFLVWALFLQEFQTKFLHFTAALMAGMALGIRPTLAPMVLSIFLPLSRYSLITVIGLSLVPLAEIAWLWGTNLFVNFLEITRFNSTIYARQGAKLPNFADIKYLLLVLVPIFLNFSKSKKIYLFVLSLFFAFLPSWPRFELIHLLPLTIVWLAFLPAKEDLDHVQYWLVFWLLLSSLVIISHTSFISRDFYFSQISSQKELITNLNSDKVLILGGPDQLYPLTNTLPPENWYLPSLPWYWANVSWQRHQSEVLKNNRYPVVLNTASRVGNQALSTTIQPILEILNTDYHLTSESTGLQIYQKNSPF